MRFPACSLPVVGAEGRRLIDGGVVLPMPSKTAKALGADIVVAVDLIACGATFRSLPRTAVGMFLQSALTLLRTASRHQHYHADVVIEPAIAHLRPDEISKREEFIDLGEKAAIAAIPSIRKLLDE